MASRAHTQHQQAIAPWELAIARALFDEPFYLRANADVRAAGLNAFEHFMACGAREGRSPNASIDLRAYLQLHPELRAAAGNPILHYLRDGLTRASSGHKLLPQASRALLAQPPVSSLTPSTSLPKDDLPLETLIPLLASKVGEGPMGLVLALSHTHYVGVTGGTENVMAAEAAAFIDAGWHYVHVCPAVPGATLLTDGDVLGEFLVLSLDGEKFGTTTATALACAIGALQGSGGRAVQLVIHHLLGFELGSVLTLARACGPAPPVVWIHDFYTLCVDPFLMRNDVQFCRAPELNSSACLVCAKGRARARHLGGMRRLFAELHPRVFAPSTPMLDIWRERSPLAYRDASVVPLARLTLGNKLDAQQAGGRRLRVAYLGAAVPFKGWPTFERLTTLLCDDDRYLFYRFGYGATGVAGLTEVDVKVTAKDPDAMVRALAEKEIDVVVNWSECFESFSYITCEALAAGAFVVARAAAGNVPHLIRSVGNDRGQSLRTEVELLAMFISGDALKLANKRLSRGRVERTLASATKLLAGANV